MNFTLVGKPLLMPCVCCGKEVEFSQFSFVKDGQNQNLCPPCSWEALVWAAKQAQMAKVKPDVVVNP